MVVRASTSTVQVRRFTRSEYERMAAQGILRPDERVELLEGAIVVKRPQGARHTNVILLIAEALRGAFGRRRTVRIQMPLAIGDLSDPEPDVAVVEGTPDDYTTDHPTTALLVVEVSDSTLALDRRKAAIYAQSKTPEYWIANLADGVLEVHRDPLESAKGTWSYTNVKRVKPAGTVQPLGAPKAKLKASDLLR